MLILAIDTSCDETSIAVCRNDRVLSNVVSSQVELHAPWGGVVPSLAKRLHYERLDPAIALALKRARIRLSQIDYFAVTIGPGLAIALEEGIAKAKELAGKYRKPLVVVNHMEGHVYGALARNRNGNYFTRSAEKLRFPSLALLVSGGHTEIVLIERRGKYRVIGETLDDAAGEAFDKIARPLGLGYPGGPIIARLAEQGDPKKFDLPRPMVHSRFGKLAANKDYNLSFSGLKTAAFILIQDLKKRNGRRFASLIPDFCASLQEAIVETLVIKSIRAVEEFRPRCFILAGGVAANLCLRSALRSALKKRGVPLIVANPELCTDNAAMIGVCAYYQVKRGEKFADLQTVDRIPNLRIDVAR